MSAASLPERFATVAELEDCLSEPTAEVAADLAKVPGDILVLGVAGKMGPTLARMAKRAAPQKRIVGVARFSDRGVRAGLEKAGVETVACDLLDRRAVEALPRLANVVFMAAMKFGASGNPALTWAMNVHVPAIVAEVDPVRTAKSMRRSHWPRLAMKSTGRAASGVGDAAPECGCADATMATTPMAYAAD